MLEKHILSKYLETLSYNFSIKVIFIFAFIGNRMDLFYFATHRSEQQAKRQKEEKQTQQRDRNIETLSI
jgi:hypothetical protein